MAIKVQNIQEEIVMCELLGINFNKPVSCGFSFRGFARRSNLNPHGWGIALYPEGDKAVQVIKESLRAGASELAGFVKHYPCFHSHVFLSHVRYATSKVCYANTHPFVREVNGREYAFAHNGVLTNYQGELPLGRWKPVGSTDSEYAFCYLLNTIEELSSEWTQNSFAELERTIKTINQYGRFNCLLTDGEYLFCYRDRAGYKGLCYTERKPPYQGNVRLIDEDMEVNLMESKGQDETGVIIATYPLTDEPWQDLCTGALMVFRQGQQVYPAREAEVNEEKLISALHLIRKSPHRQSVFEIMSVIGEKLGQASQILQPLIDKGYIRQDRRERGGPFEPFSTYYTVPAKRNEIDRLLAEDTWKVQIPAEQLDFTGAGDNEKVLACVPCLTFYKEDTSFCRKCFREVCELDTRIADIIFCLNAKGYKTRHCCAGHRGKASGPYIIFDIDASGLDAPPNFTWGQRPSDNKTLSMIPYYKVFGMTKKKMEQTVTAEALEQFRLKNLEALRIWANNLPVKE
jgi:predicted glutamine amidotransferase